MTELLNDKIDITKSKQKGKIVYKKHDWTDELNIPILIIIPSISWTLITINTIKEIKYAHLYIHFFALLLLIYGLFTIYINLSKTRKLQTIETGLSEIENRKIVSIISKNLEIETSYDNNEIFRGKYYKSFPFKQIISIIYQKDKILFNSRNICLGYNGKLGRAPWGLKSSKELYLIFRREIEEQIKMHKEK